MNYIKRFEKEIILLCFIILVSILWNTVAFNIYNSIMSTTVINTISLEQMKDVSISNTTARVIAENGTWNALNWVINSICFILFCFLGVISYKKIKRMFDNKSRG